ncbi:helix-turn-helix domain-containing protein [Robiginitalea sediminis]|uniref:helix-turn-helix domain-containing protein n=1 Tax=Robiginitalea sediminis TaxID=1982593 RepID=UPI000B4B3530|nr:helix-turn-helix domain-containing protein [Robiginitalea sediminis]
MADQKPQVSEFIRQAEAQVLEHLADEAFGVSELAAALHMSRSNLLRKIRKDAGLSASQFIRRIRLDQSLEMLREGNLTISEISYQVGFGSTSYFIKCFREQYGYPPGEASKTGKLQPSPAPQGVFKPQWKLVLGALVLMAGLILVFYLKAPREPGVTLEKSIAVLPFKNLSSDSSNAYFVNGLMESTLNNLQKIEDLRVISRTSVEQYRNTDKSIPEIAGELDVNYFVEGSGQKVGNQVLLHIQLIEVSGDRPIWSEQYNREVGDIFALQNEVARKIADAIKANVTPDELQQIQKKPTENLVAYDYYLRGVARISERTAEGLEASIPLFKKAIEEDPEFALAYANTAVAYFFMDQDKREKQYTEELNHYADNALLYDSRSDVGLIAKALYYMQIQDYRLALPYLEKALEYNPNSSSAINILADYYARIIPNTSKYLEYALKGIRLDKAPGDSISRSYTYLHLSNALVQSGFVDEALTYIEKSLAYNPQNPYSPLLNIYIRYAKHQDLERMSGMLLREWQKDTTRLDILQELAKSYYFRRDFDSAYIYYDKFVRARESGGLDIYPQEDIKIGLVYQKQGLQQQAEELYQSYDRYCERDASIYKSASTAVKYAREGRYDAAIAQLQAFSREDNIQYWMLLFMELDPHMEPLQSHPDYPGVIRAIQDRFWENHRVLRTKLQEQGLL